MNLVGIVLPGERVPSIPGKQVRYRNGRLHDDLTSGAEIVDTVPMSTPSFTTVQPAIAAVSLFSHVES
jgi:ATP-dependent Lhr-like helicase